MSWSHNSDAVFRVATSTGTITLLSTTAATFTNLILASTGTDVKTLAPASDGSVVLYTGTTSATSYIALKKSGNYLVRIQGRMAFDASSTSTTTKLNCNHTNYTTAGVADVTTTCGEEVLLPYTSSQTLGATTNGTFTGMFAVNTVVPNPNYPTRVKFAVAAGTTTAENTTLTYTTIAVQRVN